MKTALVCGAGGFIGGHLVKRLKKEGYWVRGVDLKYHEYSPSLADEYIVGDLRLKEVVDKVLDRPFDRVYQLAADMGGAGFIFTGENDADIMHNSATINLHMAERATEMRVGTLFYSSSACIYPEHNQMNPENPNTAEDSAYPAAPDSEYGWEKIFSERLYLSFARNKKLNVRIARFHNIFGPEGTWNGGREKAPAALCRKVAEAQSGTAFKLWDRGEARTVPYVEIWGDGNQTRSFLYVDECLEGVERLMQSNFIGPVNIGSDEMISINGLLEMILEISGTPTAAINHIQGPTGVRGRNSHNKLIKEKLGWAPEKPLRDGIKLTYAWISEQVHKNARVLAPRII